jgi:hypothetical protein
VFWPFEKKTFEKTCEIKKTLLTCARNQSYQSNQMATLKTTTGTVWDTLKPAYSSVITHIGNKGEVVKSKLTILGIASIHEEFMENVSDLSVVDEFGTTHQVCEDFLFQH